MAIDKAIKNAYIWYSTATDVTGKKLAETLGMKCGEKMPSLFETSLILCWGAKTSTDVDTGIVPVLNHPNKIARNRNKFEALKAMKTAGVNVAPFIPSHSAGQIAASDAAKTESEVRLPVIGRTAFHQGGKGFWYCPTATHVNEAIKDGASYFQNLIEITEEYRLHVVGDKVIYPVKKVKRTVEEMEDAFIKHETERQKELAKKNGDTLDEKTIEVFLRRQAKKFAQDGANMLIRSNRLGWKFVKMKSVNDALASEAVKALKAVGLDFGAVDCCIDPSGKPWIIEVNSGPGLEESTFDTWILALKDKINTIFAPKKEKAPTAVKPKSAVGTPMWTKEATLTAEGIKAGKKSDLITKLSLAKEMAENADEGEAAVLDKVFARMFGK